ncbi:MAG: hypothetical protein LBH17_04910 [Oscillospiraceae bacterium]|nr:hypothetical protein [Oscillospiraceae bacterium]
MRTFMQNTKFADMKTTQIFLHLLRLFDDGVAYLILITKKLYIDEEMRCALLQVGLPRIADNLDLELLAANGLYAKMYRAQAQWYT